MDKLVDSYRNKNGIVQIREFHIPIKGRVKYYVQYKAIESEEWTVIREFHVTALFNLKQAEIQFRKMVKVLQTDKFTIKPWERKLQVTSIGGLPVGMKLNYSPEEFIAALASIAKNKNL